MDRKYVRKKIVSACTRALSALFVAFSFACCFVFTCCSAGEGAGGKTAERDLSIKEDTEECRENEEEGSSKEENGVSYVRFFADGRLIYEAFLTEYETSYATLAVPEKRGYTGKWKLPTTEENGDLRVEAEYTAIVYTITYELLRGADNSDNPATYTAESETFYLSSPKASGRKFLGWYADKNYRIAAEKVEQGSVGDLTFYAKWEMPNEV